MQKKNTFFSLKIDFSKLLITNLIKKATIETFNKEKLKNKQKKSTQTFKFF